LEGLLIGTEIGDLGWLWTAQWSLFCVISHYTSSLSYSRDSTV